jgi:hypothetical protein
VNAQAGPPAVPADNLVLTGQLQLDVIVTPGGTSPAPVNAVPPTQFRNQAGVDIGTRTVTSQPLSLLQTFPATGGVDPFPETRVARPGIPAVAVNPPVVADQQSVLDE